MLPRLCLTLLCAASWLAAAPVTQTLNTYVGQLADSHNVTTLTAPNDAWEQVFDLGAAPASTTDPVVLEIDEVHQSRTQAFQYTVSVDGTTVFVRTFQELLNAPCTVMVAFERRHVVNPRSMRVRIVRGNGGAVSLARVRAHNDLYAQARAQGLDKPMGVYANVGKDWEKAISVRERYPDRTRFKTGVMFGLPYLQRSREEVADDLDMVLGIVSDQQLPFAVMFSRWWSHTATSSDGKGGNYGDLVYNQITRDPSTGALALTTPNQWGNTPWPSMRHEGANAAARAKLRAATSHFADRFALFPEAQNLSTAFVMEWGSGYWNQGDMSGRMRNAALQSGVTLSLADGLDQGEIAWMQRGISFYNDQLAGAYVEGLGSNAHIQGANSLLPPDQQLSQAIFTHTLQGTLYPSYDNRKPGWVGGGGRRMWASSEMYAFTDDRHYRYNLTQGRLACVNLEMTMLHAQGFQDYLKRAYALGMDFLVMFNPDSVSYSVSEQIALADSLQDVTCAPLPVYRRHLLDVDYLRDAQAGVLATPPAGVTHSSLTWLPADNVDKGFVRQSQPGRSGRISFVLNDPNAFATGLRLEVEAQAKDGSVSVWAGPSPERLSRVATLVDGTWSSWFYRGSRHEINLDRLATGKSQLAVEIRLEGANATSSVRAMRAFLPWAPTTVQYRPETYGERRLQSRWIQARAIVKRLRWTYSDKVGRSTATPVLEEATRLEDQGRLGDAAKLLSGALSGTLSSTLPSRIVVNKTGSLNPIKLEVGSTPQSPVLLTILNSSPQLLTLRAVSASEGTLRLKSLDPLSGPVRSIVQRGDTIEVRWDAPNRQSSGWFNLNVNELNPKLPPSPTSGQLVRIIAYLENQPEGRVLVVEVPRMLAGDHDNEPVRLRVAQNWTPKRRLADRTNTATMSVRPSQWDRARLTLNSQGEVSAVDAEYGEVEGVITRYEAPDLTQLNPHNGRITLDNGLVLELSFAKDHSKINMQPATGDRQDRWALSYRLPELAAAFRPGLRVKVSYTLPVHDGASRRILRIDELPLP